MELVDMVRKVEVLKPWGLLNIHFLFQWTIKKSTLNIYLLQLKIMMSGICKKDTDGLKASHGSISLSKVNAFNLRETLSN
jgi:hypothetical protein